LLPLGRFASPTLQDLVQPREHEREGLAAARLRQANQIAIRQQDGPALRLDGTRLRESAARGLHDVRWQAFVVEGKSRQRAVKLFAHLNQLFVTPFLLSPCIQLR